MRRRQVYVSVAAGKTETAVHIIHNIHICGCVKMHLFTHPQMSKNAPVFFFMWMCYDENNEEW